MSNTLLHGLRVLALGQRQAVRLCCKLLGHAGAMVSSYHAAEGDYDEATLREAVLRTDVLLLSSDAMDPLLLESARLLARQAGTVMLCDITAAGARGPYSRDAHTDVEIQALTGLLDTTGFADAAPTPIGLPYCEVSAALYAALAVTAALIAWRRDGLVQDVEVSLYGAAANALTTFLPHVFAGQDPHRLGNRHSSAAPWNAYRTADGWVLLCTSTQQQWQRLCDLVDDPQLAADDFATPHQRLINATRLDRAIGAWTAQFASDDCLLRCAQAGIPAGPILPLEHLIDDPNVRHRGVVRAYGARDDISQWSAAAPFRLTPWPTAAATSAPASAAASPDASLARIAGPLRGFRVIEIGQYTTAPLVGKHLAALGAEVIKIEPPGGDPTREWPHGQGDTSYFFALSNTDKSSVILDLKTPAGKAGLRALLADADVLVENLRPGAMARLGFDIDTLAQHNPRLVYCAISGFGADSAYPGRPAFDTVIQAMSGFMDLTRSNGMPVKAGISAADILSGQMALFVVIAALLRRDHSSFGTTDRAGNAGNAGSGVGAAIDIAMQDVAVWATATRWDAQPGEEQALRCRDGYLLVRHPSPSGIGADEFADLSRSEAQAQCAIWKVPAVPIYSVAEAMRDPHFTAHTLSLGMDQLGRFWPVLAPPYHYSISPGPPGRVLAGAPA